jgi:hypothetical protein
VESKTDRPNHGPRHRKSRNRQVLGVTDFEEEEIELIERAVAPSEAAKFDHEIG